MRLFLITYTVILLQSQSSTAQPTAERILPERGYLPGTTVKVDLQVSNIPSESILIDIPPKGWEIIDASRVRTIEDGQIKFKLRKYRLLQTISYLLMVPESAEGEYSFNGSIDENETGGMTVIAPMIPEPLGMFDNHIDLGYVEYSQTGYDSQTGKYIIEAGLSPFENALDGHYLYKKVAGDFSIQVHAKAENDNEYLRYYSPALLVIFDNINNQASFFGLETKANGECWFAWGQASDMVEKAGEIAWSDFHDGRMKLERNGNVMKSFYFDTEENDWVEAAEKILYFDDPVYIGIGSRCVKGQYNVSTFWDVKLTYGEETLITDWELH